MISRWSLCRCSKVCIKLDIQAKLPLAAVPPQDGTKLALKEDDRKALVIGMVLHNKGRASLAAVRVACHL
jgi:hypothetical protein